MNIREITNRLARNSLTHEERGELVRQLTPQMRDGYRLAFPMLAVHGKALLCIVLLARADERLARLACSLKVNSKSTNGPSDHVFVLLSYENEVEWMNQAKEMITVYPEQTDAEEFRMDFGQGRTTGPVDIPNANDPRNTDTTPEEIIDRNLGAANDSSQRYHSALPPELSRWYCYPRDGGHSIMVVLKRNYRQGMSIEEASKKLVPAPVKAVRRGYTFSDGLIIIDVPHIDGWPSDDVPLPRYSTALGLEVREEDAEFTQQGGPARRGSDLLVANDGIHVIRTNYFESEHAKNGLAYLSVNAGAFRLFLPDPLLPALAEMRTGKYVIVSDTAGHAQIEMLFEDGTDTPYVLLIDGTMCDRHLPAHEDGRTDLRFLVYGPNSRVLLDRPARYRQVANVPWMRPWGR